MDFLRGLLLIGFLSAGAYAQQNTATILGTVVDPSGASIAGAKVTATGEQTGSRRTVQSDSGEPT